MSKDAEKPKQQQALRDKTPRTENPRRQPSLFDWAQYDFRIKSINTAVAVFALLVSFVSLFLAADTSNIRAAIQTLSALADETKRQADMTAKEVAYMRSARRPWVSVSIDAGDLSWTSNGASVSAVITLRNSGQLPARIRGLQAVLQTPFARDPSQRPINWIRENASAMKSQSVPSQGLVVFPGQQQIIKEQLVLPRADIQAFASYISTARRSSSMDAPSVKDESDHPFMPLAIAYAADYASGQGDHGQTYCWLSVEQKDPSNPGGPSITPRIDINVGSGNLVLLNEDAGCSAT